MQGWLIPVIMQAEHNKYLPWPVDLVRANFPIEVAIRYKRVRREFTSGLRKAVREAQN